MPRLKEEGRGRLKENIYTHVVQPAHEGRGPARTARRTARSAQSTQTALNMAREYLKATINQLRDGSLDKGITDLDLEITFTVTVDDDIAQSIIRVAENGGDGEGAEVFGGCDIITMTTQGYSGPQPWVGSVTERVLETSRLPLLCVRPGA
jgi:nucleotide-binding universal stress UspA family protein